MKSISLVLALLLFSSNGHANTERVLSTQNLNLYCWAIETGTFTHLVSSKELIRSMTVYQSDIAQLKKSFSNKATNDEQLRQSAGIQLNLIQIRLQKESFLQSWILSDISELIRAQADAIQQSPIPRLQQWKLLDETSKSIESLKGCAQ